ncbi:MAG: hypothetical protein E7672_06740 [Ruminococcaceae bacterium]|nr:hypothetical protein [Oscillospiraceae bacterium]
METKRNLKYFTAPPISIVSIIGWAIVIVGALLFSMSSTRIAGIIVCIVGLLLAVMASGGASNDTDIEYQISERIRDLQEQSEKKNEVYEKHFLKMLKPVDLRGYDFETKEEPFYYKKGKDGVARTNYFNGTNLIFTNEKMFVYTRHFSIIDESIDDVNTYSLFFTELEKAEVEEKVYTYKKGDKEIEVKYYVFRIIKTDGTNAVEMCVDYGADIDKYEEMISRAITTRKKELAKRAEETAARRAAFRAQVEAERAAEAAAKAAEEANK